MSELSSDVIGNFASMVIGEPEEEKPNSIYGTVAIIDGEKYAKIDGTDIYTPILASVEVENDDRVLLEIEGRQVTAVANITAPASARTASNFIKLTDNGFMVGQLDKEGKPTGAYTLMKPDSFNIVDVYGRILASFTSSAITFGNKATFGEDGVVLRDGSGEDIAAFTKSGIDFYGKNYSEIRFGFDKPTGKAQMILSNDGLVFENSWASFISPDNAQLMARRDDNNYAFLRVGYYTGNAPFLDAWGNEANITTWRMRIDKTAFYVYGNGWGFSIGEDTLSFQGNGWGFSIGEDTLSFQGNGWGFSIGEDTLSFQGNGWSFSIGKDSLSFQGDGWGFRILKNNVTITLNSTSYSLFTHFATKTYVDEKLATVNNSISTLQSKVDNLERGNYGNKISNLEARVAYLESVINSL